MCGGVRAAQGQSKWADATDSFADDDPPALEVAKAWVDEVTNSGGSGGGGGGGGSYGVSLAGAATAAADAAPLLLLRLGRRGET